MIKTSSEQSHFQDYKDVIILKFVESTVWLALRFRERKLIFLSWSVSLEKNFLKKNRRLTPSFGHQSRLPFIFSVRIWKDMSKRHTLVFCFQHEKNKTTKAYFKKWRTNTWHSTRQSITFSPGPCLWSARLIFRENVLIYVFFLSIRKWTILTKAARTKLTFFLYRCRICRILPSKNKKRSNRKL